MCDSLGRASQVCVSIPRCKSRSDDGFAGAQCRPPSLRDYEEKGEYSPKA